MDRDRRPRRQRALVAEAMPRRPGRLRHAHVGEARLGVARTQETQAAGGRTARIGHAERLRPVDITGDDIPHAFDREYADGSDGER
jgi:hypothetical protein